MRVSFARDRHPHVVSEAWYSGRTRRPADAWRNAQRVAARLGLSVKQPNCPSPDASASYVVPTSLLSGQTVVASATGKGLGRQAWASGLYEAFEHAAAQNALPGSADSPTRAVLPPSDLERLDLRYRYARKARGDTPQPLTEFKRGGTATFYPSIACDFSYQIREDETDLLYLDRTCTGKGYASGWGERDAEIHALNELVEHDAFSAYLLGSELTGEYPTAIDFSAAPLANSLLAELTLNGGEDISVVLLPSVVSRVVLTWLKSPSGELLCGLGCSYATEIALVRSLTEAHQELFASAVGATWIDEGGHDLGNLDSFPELRSRAEPKAPTTLSSIDLRDLMASDSRSSVHPGPELESLGHPFLSRKVWAADRRHGHLAVVQVVTPTLERFADIVFGLPVIPTGRLHSSRITQVLTRRELN